MVTLPGGPDRQIDGGGANVVLVVVDVDVVVDVELVVVDELVVVEELVVVGDDVVVDELVVVDDDEVVVPPDDAGLNTAIPAT